VARSANRGCAEVSGEMAENAEGDEHREPSGEMIGE
jgi:hypothetical protein